MGLPTFHFAAVIPDDDGSFVASHDPAASMSEVDQEISFLHDEIERGRIADCPSLWFIQRADFYDGDEEVDADETFDGGDDPAELLELLDGLERALGKHGSAPPVFTMFYWSDSKGKRCGSTVVRGRFDGHTCRLFGGWDRSILAFMFVKPRRPALPITGDRITLEEHTDGWREIDVHRTTLADYYRPKIGAMRSVCRYAVEKKGFVRSSFVR